MNISDYIYLINKPNALTEKRTLALEKVLDEFPFFQSARALRLKGLYSQNSFNYNSALKVTAAHTTDRAVLFDFINSYSYQAIQKDLYEKKTDELHSIDVVDSEIMDHNDNSEKYENQASKKEFITNFTAIASEDLNPNYPSSIEQKLEIGKPLDFSADEKHSFQEWLQISKIQPIVRETESNTGSNSEELDEVKRKREALIDKFIETSPKISPIKQGSIPVVNFDINKEDNTSLMTETLAKVYLEQKKYQKAIQAYEILILKYPEKSSLFADRISDIKLLQQNNNN